MGFKQLKIGYVPYSEDLSQPGDRRRFSYFAGRNNIAFEIADDNKSYDVILVTAASNLSLWLRYKRDHPETKFIFEMVDSLIFSTDIFNTLFRGVGRFLQHTESRPYLNFKTPIFKWIKVADVVICSSTEVKQILQKWNQKVIISLDYLQDEVRYQKTNYEIRDKMKLVWEGQGGVLPHLLRFKEVFREVSSFCELHIITDEKYRTYGNLVPRTTLDLVKRLPIETFFHKWEILKNYQELCKYDCGIIPLDRKNTFGWHKPANKLISFWYAALPSIVSDTPAYMEMMKNAGQNLYCGRNDEWIKKIHEVNNMNSNERSKLATDSRNYVQQHFSDRALDEVWFNIFMKAGYDLRTD